MQRTISELIAIADVITLDAAIIRSATQMEAEYGLTGQDAIVLASVLSHLESNPAESCFLNRNSKDFDDPDIRDRLDTLNCKFFAGFSPAVPYISARLRGGP